MQRHDESTAEVRSGNPRYDMFRKHDMTGRFDGDTAIVNGMTSIRGSHDREPFELDAQFTDTPVKRANRCKLVASLAPRIER